MIGATPIFHALESGSGSVRLVGGETLAPGVVFTRASAAMALGADGATWQQAASNLPRLTGTGRRLLVESARTNTIRNPRGEGAVAGLLGAGGALPTNWTVGNTAGLATEVIGSGTEAGLPYVEIRISGTPNGALYQLNQDSVFPSAAAGDDWTYSLFSRQSGGSLANLGQAVLAVTIGAASSNTGYTLGTGPLATTRRAASVLNSAGGSTVARWRLGVTTGQAVDVMVRLGVPQFERSAFATSPVLPPAGTVATSTRAVDAPIFPLSAAQRIQGTLVGTILLPQLPPASVSAAGVFQLDDGTNATRLPLRVLPTGAVRLVGSGAATALDLAVGSLAAGTITRFAVSYGGDGVSACLNGGPVATAAGTVVPPGITALVIGHGSRAYDLAVNGEIGPLTLHPSRLPDATLQALTSL